MTRKLLTDKLVNDLKGLKKRCACGQETINPDGKCDQCKASNGYANLEE